MRRIIGAPFVVLGFLAVVLEEGLFKIVDFIEGRCERWEAFKRRLAAARDAGLEKGAYHGHRFLGENGDPAKDESGS